VVRAGAALVEILPFLYAHVRSFVRTCHFETISEIDFIAGA